jgi:glycosyltransferase involved in cell wall biosynthesis
MTSVAIGITTYNRPDSFTECIDSVLEFAPHGSHIFVSDDGSTADYEEVFASAANSGVTVFQAEHGNIAISKNRLLTAMLSTEADHFFIIEDDVRPTSTSAFRQYLDMANRRSMQHSMFGAHGHRNRIVAEDHSMRYFFECVGAWCYYSRNAIETVGLMDEEFENCWEHVVHSMLIADVPNNLMPNAGWRLWPDGKSSSDHIENIDVASTHVVGTEAELMSEVRVQRGLKHWMDNYRLPNDILPLYKPEILLRQFDTKL